MATNLFCSNCKSTSSLKAKVCRKCGQDFGDSRKYRVVVKSADGRRVSKVLDSLVMARKLERKLRDEAVEKNLFGIAKAPLVDDIWLEYLKWAKQNKKRWKEEEWRWKSHIEVHLKGKTMDSVIPHDISNLIDDMKKKRAYAPATIKLVLFLTKRLYNWAAQMGLYEGKNPAASIKSPRLNNEVTECLTHDEIKRLMATLEGWWNRRVALVVKFALYTGLRRSEIFGLAWQNVDLLNGLITLRNTKGGKDEILPLSDEALKIVIEAKHILPNPDCPFVFSNRWGRKRVSFGNTWTYIKRAAKLPPDFRFHGLRHTFASYLASSGKVSTYTLQRLLTHKSPQMTQRYAHLFDQTLREGANLLPSLF